MGIAEKAMDAIKNSPDEDPEGYSEILAAWEVMLANKRQKE